MDEDGSNNNTKSETSQSSEESNDLFEKFNECVSKDDNAWLHLKTITTFDTGTSSELRTCETKIRASNVSLFKVEKPDYDGRPSDEGYHQYIDDFVNIRNDDHQDQISVDNGNVPSTRNGYQNEEALRSNIRRRNMRRRKSNSFSEGNLPFGMVADPVSHFSVSSNPSRNGTVSDVGVDRTNASLGSPAPVQSLTRFSPTSLLVESLIDQLCKLMEKDSRKQRKLYHVICERLHQMQLIDDTYTIEEFQFMRSHYQKALYQLLAVAKSSTQPSGTRNILLPLPSSTMNVDIKLNSEQVLEWSRYQHEYQELEYLAKGGFGHVYKVRNKLDGGEYAIKKIFLRYRYVEGFLRSLKEVKMLARLNHPNIVSYKAAWLEPMEGKKSKSHMQKSSQSSTSQEASVSVFSMNSNSRLPLPPAPAHISEDSLDIVFQDSSPENRSNCSHISKSSRSPLQWNQKDLSNSSGSRTHPSTELLGRSTLSSHDIGSNSSSPSDNSDEGDSSETSDESAAFPMKTKAYKENSTASSFLRNWATLYVQMQLCERTLRQWLDVRNATLPAYPLAPSSSEGTLAMNLFLRIVNGIDYIHAQGIVHHDIKPSNIFVSGTLKEVQVGDFGLSCCILSRVDSSGVVGEHHGEVGTRMYAAPEQLRGRCTSKSDLYSLGIVLLELLHPFHTDMERSKVIQKLRTGHLPSDLSTTWPHAARVISDLLQKSPAARPSANELLQRVESLLRSNMESDLSSQLATKDETIRLLKEAVASRDQEIAKLRQRLSFFEK
ncbi:hypothetical protein ONE63_004424 [Megalurothrips usitatus]|uniref:non-specific serine/threonine protein kinase n=1 Tax=Megalurothrips usitatus TaxID=439358 RepID=A0AAV7X8D8_9NEOP|nr:hypothetical protein ONE63_004424 [Megalurothrips usitatus]